MNKIAFRRNEMLGSQLALDSAGGPTRGTVAGSSILSHYLAIGRRRKWLIIGAIALSLVAGLVVTLLMTPRYTSTSTLEIARESDRIVNVQGVEQESSPVDLEFYQTQYGLLEAASLAERVAVDLKLVDDQSFYVMFGAPEADTWFENGRLRGGESSREERVQKAGQILLRHVRIIPERLSRLVEIRFTSPDAVFSQRVVQAWSQGFIEETLERRFQATAYARRFLEQRLEQLRTRLEQSERRAVAYAGQQGIINLPSATPSGGGVTGERSLVAEDLASLNRELAQATADKLRAQSRLRESRSSVSETLENAAISGLRQRRAELAAEYAKLQVQFEPGYPPARSLQSQIEQLDRSIAREESRVGNSLTGAYQAAATREASLQQAVGALKGNLLDLRRRSIQYTMYQRDVDTNRQLYDALLQRYKEIGVAGGIGVNNISVVDPAAVPRLPSSPNLIVNMLVALLGGMAVGIGIALALEQIDEGIVDPGDVERSLGLPLLGVVPKVASGDPTDQLQDRKSPVSEAYLSVQTNLAFSTEHGAPRTLAITSTRPGEGKSTTGYAIAHALARGGKKVVLIDADMRSPSVHHLFGLDNKAGLSNFLAGDDDLAKLVHADVLDGLSVVAAGPQPPSAAELLSGGRFDKLIAAASKMFDHVVFDAPPIMGLADAPLISSKAEGTVFVIESHGTRTSVAQTALSRLHAANAQIVGSVLTKFETKRAHHGYGYDYGYGYGEPAPRAA